MVGGALYLESSALLKLVVTEAESQALIASLADRPALVTSRLSTIEVRRAVTRRLPSALGVLDGVLGIVILLEIDALVAATAATIRPEGLRTLDAIHLATALGVRDDIEAIVTYDRRLAEAARAVGLPVLAPA